MRPVGVLGGMGPEATILFMQRCMERVDARDDADHVPLLVDQNTQVPSRIAAILEGNGADPFPVLALMAQRLEASGAQALVMPCNTAHHFADRLREEIDIPLLSMVGLVARHAANIAPGGRIGLLGSPALTRVGVFDRPLLEAGVSPVILTNPDRVLSVIRAIKSGKVDRALADALSEEAAAMAQEGADAICICCTEFSLIARDVTAPVAIFDALDLLVDAAVQFSRGHGSSGQSGPASG